MQKRIQRKRTAGYNMPENAKYVGRPTRWGNPYHVQAVGGSFVLLNESAPETELRMHNIYRSRETAIKSAVDLYGYWLELQLLNDPYFLDELFEFDLACWCNLESPCHVDVILKKIAEFRQLDTVLDEAVKKLASERIQTKEVLLEIPIEQHINYAGFGKGELACIHESRKTKAVYYKSEKVVKRILSIGRVTEEEVNRKFAQFKKEILEKKR